MRRVCDNEERFYTPNEMSDWDNFQKIKEEEEESTWDKNEKIRIANKNQIEE